MAQDDGIAAIAGEARAWRRGLHEFPELLFDLPKTSAFVRDKLIEFGCDEVVDGIATSGVVGVIKGRLGPGRTIGLRSDMDALPIDEQTNLAHASKVPGKMHACGHDGHTATLLAAAKHLCATRDFSGSVVVIFQPAEEGGGGALVMIEEGLLERFAIDEVYGMHNQPGLPVGSFAIRPGPMLAAADRFVIELVGEGGHAASPHLARDPVIAGVHLVGALQTIVSRQVDPLDSAVLSITYFNGGKPNALNVIPSRVEVGGTLRTLKPETRRDLEQRIRDIVSATARLFGMEARIDWQAGYPVTANDPAATRKAADTAASVAGAGRIVEDWPITMGAEDFSYMLERRPGAFIWLGNGDSAELHNPAYDFNDEAIAWGARYWTELVGRLLPQA